MDVYDRLYRRYGPQGWWPGEGPFETIAGAILTQATAWTNVERALSNLKAEGCWSWPSIHRIPQDQLARIVRPSGYFNAKARKLKAFAAHVVDNHGGDLDAFLSLEQRQLREELLSIYGIGPETADDIVLYAANKPSFVIDAYTRRIVDRLGFPGSPAGAGYYACQSMFQDNLPRRRPAVPGIPRPAGPPRQGNLRQNPPVSRLLPPGNMRRRPIPSAPNPIDRRPCVLIMERLPGSAGILPAPYLASYVMGYC